MFDFFDSSTWNLILSVLILIDALQRRKDKKKMEELEEENEYLRSVINQKHT